MIATFERQTLLAALTKVSAIVGRKQTVPILSHILIEADKGAVTFKATSLDMEATVTTRATVGAPGRCCAPADSLLNIAKNASEGADIVLTLKERLNVKSGRSNFNLSVLPPDDFPTFADMPNGQTLTMTGAQMDGLIGRVAFAAGVDASRYILTGINLSAADGAISAGATNVKQLAVSKMDFACEPFNITLPAPLVTEMRRVCGDNNQEVEFTIAQGRVRLDAGETVIVGKLLDGQYVDISRGIPGELPHALTVDRMLIEGAFRRVMVAIDDTARSCRLTIGDGRMRFDSRAQDLDAADEIDIDYSGPEVSIGVNSKNVLDGVSACGSELVEICFGSGEDPLLMRTPSDEAFLSVCSTLRS